VGAYILSVDAVCNSMCTFFFISVVEKEERKWNWFKCIECNIFPKECITMFCCCHIWKDNLRYCLKIFISFISDWLIVTIRLEKQKQKERYPRRLCLE
jgi:hypothetical protein